MMTTTKPTDRLILTAAERRVLLEEYDSYPRGDARRGARLQRGDAALDAQAPGPKPHPRHPLADDVTRLTRENARLQAQLASAELVIEIQKKVATLLGLATSILPSDNAS